MREPARLYVLVLLLGLSSLLPGGLDAQLRIDTPPFVGSEAERYLRTLATAGKLPSTSWSARPFAPAQLRELAPADSLHPWGARYSFASDSGGGWRFAVVSPEVQLFYQSGRNERVNDGALWVGRGLTTSLSGGFAGGYGPVSWVVDPVGFWAQNRDFTLEGVDVSADSTQYMDARRGGHIDLPQRFGNGAYARLDLGQSTLQLDWMGANLGVSTANQYWGPSFDYPIILGSNAAGFPHLFAGTSRPLDLWIATIQARVVWGELFESAYAPTSVSDRRFMSGYVASISPRGLGGLELGISRFFHSPWPEGGPGWSDFLMPLSPILKEHVTDALEGGDSRSDNDNQLSSAFFRWPFAAAGLEVYGEFGREDHNWDLRDFLLEPDHSSAAVVGMSKVWESDPEHLLAFRFEHGGAITSPLEQVRHQASWYTHSRLRQGHTFLGQILGAPALFVGSGTAVTIDHYSPAGRITFKGTRTVRQGSESDEVAYSVAPELLLFRGPTAVAGALSATRILNYQFTGIDSWNIGASLSVLLGVGMGR